MSLEFSPSFVELLDFDAALATELERPPDRLPSRVADSAVAERSSEYADRVKEISLAGFDPAREEIVWMPKARYSFRPLSALPLRERVVYRALGQVFSRTVNTLDQYRATQDSFEWDLLEEDEDESIRYVVIADVTSFYRYVSHSRLEQRLVETTARADLAKAVRRFLDLTMNSDVGVPQNLGPSDLFADVLLTPVERRLLRAGIPTTRFNDDFRLGATSLTVAREAIEMLQQLLHAVGLTLNEAKTLILRRDRFSVHVGQLLEDEYREEVDTAPEEPTPDAVNDTVTALGNALQIDQRLPTRRTRLEDARAINKVRRALRRLTAWSSPAGLVFGRPIINRHPPLTQNYARYARHLVDSGYANDVEEYLEGSLERMVLTEWQELWLLEPLLPSSEHGALLSQWIQRRAEDGSTPSLLRSRALLAAARAGLVSADYVSGVIDTLPPAAQPDAIAAYASAASEPDAANELGGLEDSLLAERVFLAAFDDNQLS